MTCHCNTSPVNPDPRPDRNRVKGKGLNFFAGGLLLIMPKCAMCWAAYLGFFGWTGLSALAYRPWFLPAAILLFSFTLGRLLWRAMARRNYLAFSLASTAALLIAWQKWTGAENIFGIVAIGLMGLAWFIDYNGLSARFRFTHQPAE